MLKSRKQNFKVKRAGEVCCVKSTVSASSFCFHSQCNHPSRLPFSIVQSRGSQSTNVVMFSLFA